MNVALIDVGTTRAEINEPLGLEIIAGVVKQTLKEENMSLECLQFSDGKLIDTSKIQSADIVGISTKLYSLERVNKILSLTKRSKKEPIVILGDLLATFAPEHFLDDPNVICVIGEGEEAIRDIIKLTSNQSIDDIEEIKARLVKQKTTNLAFRLEDQIVKTERKLVDLHNVPIPYRYFLDKVIQVQGIVRLESSRGCPWGKCSFCAISAKYGYPAWRPFPTDYIIDELETISNAGGLNPYFTDEDFIAGKPQRLIEFNEKLQQAKEEGRINPKLQYYVNMTANDVIANVDIIKELKKTGLREVFLGLESGAENQMDRYSKMASVEINLRATRILADLEIVLDSGFIMFDPEMSIADLKENMEFIKNCGLINHDARDVKKVRIEPGTELAVQSIGKDNVFDLDVDSLTYDYTFKDPLVQRIWDIYQKWESGSIETVYKFQGLTRGEIDSENRRLEMKATLGKFRENDYYILKSLIDLSHNNPKSLNDDDFVKKYINKYHINREDLLSHIKRKWDIW